MGIYKDIYDFASKAGALEGYLYPKEKVDLKYIPGWVDNIVNKYRELPPEAREEFQELCNRTIGRALQSLLQYIGEDHEVIKKLRGIISGKLPSSYDDFD